MSFGLLQESLKSLRQQQAASTANVTIKAAVSVSSNASGFFCRFSAGAVGGGRGGDGRAGGDGGAGGGDEAGGGGEAGSGDGGIGNAVGPVKSPITTTSHRSVMTQNSVVLRPSRYLIRACTWGRD